MLHSFLSSVTRNPLSLIGTAITTIAVVMIITLFAFDTFGLIDNPYVGILTYLVLPLVFVAGLSLIPLGSWIWRRRAGADATPAFPVIDFNRPATQRWLFVFVALSAVNVVILALATYKGVEVMDSTEFCGLTCHSVMAPEHTAHARSPHADVACVACHIGPGAGSFVQAKLSGAWQVVSVNLDLYPRPIPTPVHGLRPASETCGHCHDAERWVGDRLAVLTQFASDEANTELKTVLGMKVGGWRPEAASGIHWHADPRVRIRYRSDPTRTTIHEVELTHPSGEVELFLPEDGATGSGEWRVMDCTDCHNRATHVFHAPEVEIDAALAEGRLPRSLPHLRREGLRVLKESYPSHDAAREGIARGLEAFYAEQYPDLDRSQVADAGRVLGELYAVNVFPAMNVGWNTYPDHSGHEAFPGCFRCHDDLHTSAAGRTISQDCERCHALIALGEENPEILAALGQ